MKCGTESVMVNPWRARGTPYRERAKGPNGYILLEEKSFGLGPFPCRASLGHAVDFIHPIKLLTLSIL